MYEIHDFTVYSNSSLQKGKAVAVAIGRQLAVGARVCRGPDWKWVRGNEHLIDSK